MGLFNENLLPGETGKYFERMPKNLLNFEK